MPELRLCAFAGLVHAAQARQSCARAQVPQLRAADHDNGAHYRLGAVRCTDMERLPVFFSVYRICYKFTRRPLSTMRSGVAELQGTTLAGG